MKRQTLTVQLKGGLGNQLHCYAFGKSLGKKLAADIQFDCETGFKRDKLKRMYLLDHFPNAQVRKQPTNSITQQVFRQRATMKAISLASSILPIQWRPVVTEPPYPGYKKQLLTAKYKLNTYFSGHWISYCYQEAADIAEELRDQLSPPKPREPIVLNELHKIKKTLSCFVHWRSYKESADFAIHPSMTTYYSAAMDAVKTKHPGITFFVFSDDPSGARSQIGCMRKDIVFVDLPPSKGNYGSLNDFYLMYSCDHAIIGDSTYSWWAAWLDKRECKTVCAPTGLPWVRDWSPPNWMTFNI